MAGSCDLKVPPGVVPKNLPVYAALGIAAGLILVMLFTGSAVPPDESAGVGGEEVMEAVVADVRDAVAPVLRQRERLREDLARPAGTQPRRSRPPEPGGTGLHVDCVSCHIPSTQ